MPEDVIPVNDRVVTVHAGAATGKSVRHLPIRPDDLA